MTDRHRRRTSSARVEPVPGAAGVDVHHVAGPFERRRVDPLFPGFGPVDSCSYRDAAAVLDCVRADAVDDRAPRTHGSPIHQLSNTRPTTARSERGRRGRDNATVTRVPAY